MAGTIDSEDDLADDIQSKVSSTFDLNFIRKLLRNSYYKGPIVEGEGGRGGHGLRHRGYALAGMPSSHRKSVMRKATEVDLVVELNNGYATTARGSSLLRQMTDCEECGEREVPTLMPVGRRHSAFVNLLTFCPNCNDFEERSEDSRFRYGKKYRFNRDEESLREAVEAMVANENVVLWLNNMTLDKAVDELGD
jgi:hypothetical protein